MSPNVLSALIKGRLKDLGMTQVQFADAIAVEQTTVSKWLTGKVIPSDKVVPRIAHALRLEEAEVWSTRSAAQEERLRRFETGERAARRERDKAHDTMRMFTEKYEELGHTYARVGAVVEEMSRKADEAAKKIAKQLASIDERLRRLEENPR